MDTEDQTPDQSLTTVDRFLHRRDEQRRKTKRFYASGLLFGGLIAVVQLLAAHGIVPEAGRDAALSTAAMLFGFANTRG